MSTTLAPAFEALPAWGESLPDLRRQDVSDIAVDSHDNVYLLYRDPSAVVVCGPEGDQRATWAADVLSRRPHGITAAEDGRFYVVDEGDHCVRLFDGAGNQLAAFGSGPSNPAFAGAVTGELADHISRGYPPFTRPTRLALARGGELYVSDGYGNCRIHRYAADGRLVQSWGEPGTAPGQFHIPHHVYVDRDERVLVCDRENDRIQLFSPEGVFLEQWTDFRRPQAVVQGPDRLYYVAEGAWRKGHVSRMHGPVGPAASRVSVVGHDGRVLGRLGGTEASCLPGSFIAAHGIAVDSKGNLYVAEVSISVMGRFPDPAAGPCKVVQKFRRVAPA